MQDKIVKFDDTFWNVRGSFKIGGLIDAGTHTSLAQLGHGKFVLLDAYAFEGEIKEEIMDYTSNGELIEAIFNLHPFHTASVEEMAGLLPQAKLYGTSRHVSKFPKLSWEPQLTESAAFHALYEEDFTFSVPAGVDLVPEKESLHFASVLCYHKASRTLHVDDTLTWIGMPLVGGLKFHPALEQALQKRAGAADEFWAWTGDLLRLAQISDHLCTSHTKALTPQGEDEPSIAARVEDAVAQIKGVVDAHRDMFG